MAREKSPQGTLGPSKLPHYDVCFWLFWKCLFCNGFLNYLFLKNLVVLLYPYNQHLFHLFNRGAKRKIVRSLLIRNTRKLSSLSLCLYGLFALICAALKCFSNIKNPCSILQALYNIIIQCLISPWDTFWRSLSKRTKNV